MQFSSLVSVCCYEILLTHNYILALAFVHFLFHGQYGFMQHTIPIKDLMVSSNYIFTSKLYLYSTTNVLCTVTMGLNTTGLVLLLAGTYVHSYIKYV